MVETMLFRTPGDCAILVQISSAPCRERIYPFRLLVALWRFSYTFIAASRPETADETVKLSRYVSALLSFLHRNQLAPLSRGAGSFAAEGLN